VGEHFPAPGGTHHAGPPGAPHARKHNTYGESIAMTLSINFPKDKDINDPDALRIVLESAIRLASAPISGLVIKVREDGQVVNWTLAGQEEIEMMVAGLSITKPDAQPTKPREEKNKTRRSFSP
jgi:hypothetical protein